MNSKYIKTVNSLKQPFRDLKTTRTIAFWGTVFLVSLPNLLLLPINVSTLLTAVLTIYIIHLATFGLFCNHKIVLAEVMETRGNIQGKALTALNKLITQQIQRRLLGVATLLLIVSMPVLNLNWLSITASLNLIILCSTMYLNATVSTLVSSVKACI